MLERSRLAKFGLLDERWRTEYGGRHEDGGIVLRTFRFVVERDPETGLLVGYVPGWPGAHTQGTDLDELQQNLREVIEMLLEDREPVFESELVDVRTIQVA